MLFDATDQCLSKRATGTYHNAQRNHNYIGYNHAMTIKPLLSGDFGAGPFGSVTGKAEIYKQGAAYSLKLSGFSSSNGPALHVYLSKEPMPVTYIDLGVLKSTNGNQVYAIAGSPDFAEYSYVSIHCVAYNHLFGSARLK